MLPDPRFTPVISIIEAGKLLGLGRDSAYAAAHRGEIPVLRIGRKLVVPTARLLREVLGIETSSASEPTRYETAVARP